MRPKKISLVPAPEPEQGPAPEGKIGFLLRVAMQRHTAIFTSHMIEGLTQTQFSALAKLYEVGPCSQNQLGRLICLDAATIKGVVDRLCLRQLLTAVNDVRDRRRRAVALTSRGKEVIANALMVVEEIVDETLQPLSSDERDTLVRLLDRLC